MKIRYIMAKAIKIDIAFAEPNSLQKREGLYEVIEIDLETEPKEITLLDVLNKQFCIIDLTSEDVQKISIENISENDIIFAKIYSKATALGNTATWHFNVFDKK